MLDELRGDLRRLLACRIARLWFQQRHAYGKRKLDQIEATEATYVLTPCHNCHSQMEDLAHHYGGDYRVVHFWTLICLALGILGADERKYLGPDLQDVGLPQ